MVGYERYYEVSNRGSVRSLDRVTRYPDGSLHHFTGKVLTPMLSARRYPAVHLVVQVKNVTRAVHVLVAAAFLGPRPPGMHICHGDGNPRNNRVGNLRYDTPAANARDTVRHGRNQLTGRIQCPRGHRLDAPNLVACAARRGHRTCLACSRANATVRNAAGRGVTLDFVTEAARHYARITAEADTA